MLKDILSISGKPGLYKLIAHSKNALIVENITTKKRQPAYAADRVMSLGDIAIYTTSEEVPLWRVMKTILDKFNAEQLDTNQYQTPEQLAEFFVQILPDYDTNRVYKTDIKKVITWYNLLVEAGLTDFEPEQKAEEKPEETPTEQ